MRIEDSFRVNVPVEETWKVLLDIERIAPCMPGAELQEIEGDEYRGIVKVKVGPITAQYKGTARIEETDDVAHRAVIKASGRDTRGQGNASATITAVLSPDGDGTVVNIETDLSITGKVAQFGRGVLGEVSSKILGQFVACLESDVLSGNPSAEAGAAPVDAPAEGPTEPLETAAPSAAAVSGNGASTAIAETGNETPATPVAPAEGIRKIESKPAEPVDLLAVSGNSVLRRLIPVAIVALVLVVIFGAGRRRRRKRSS